MSAQLRIKQVGPWSMNTYLVVCTETGISAIIDPGADAQAILEQAVNTKVGQILITHAHEDHVGALEKVRTATGAPVYLHPADAEAFSVPYDIPLMDGDVISVGNQQLKVIHTPGHTPGATCFDLGDSRILVGDALFVGGPGATQTPQDFALTMKNMQAIFFSWPDEIVFYPGHGPSGRIGEERAAFEKFVKHGWANDLYGDVTWT